MPGVGGLVGCQPSDYEPTRPPHLPSIVSHRRGLAPCEPTADELLSRSGGFQPPMLTDAYGGWKPPLLAPPRPLDENRAQPADESSAERHYVTNHACRFTSAILAILYLCAARSCRRPSHAAPTSS